MIVFAFPPYSPELNKIKNTFGGFNIFFQNLNGKDIKSIILKEKK